MPMSKPHIARARHFASGFGPKFSLSLLRLVVRARSVRYNHVPQERVPSLHRIADLLLKPMVPSALLFRPLNAGFAI
ncbi:hypothetical protein BD410DRAFT_845933 [Rickenella mellea]|uniref:Uncharacterized protein n=1 Tax=Rickenella mellea TaxID=50990 RepID=A0A4Y7PJE7_9AGAM|nr:hypothetical protein BD410DRAFT_845933 [Rickenella mellea]